VEGQGSLQLSFSRKNKKSGFLYDFIYNGTGPTFYKITLKIEES